MVAGGVLLPSNSSRKRVACIMSRASFARARWAPWLTGNDSHAEAARRTGDRPARTDRGGWGGLPAAAGGLVNPPGAGVREGGALAAAEIARR